VELDEPGAVAQQTEPGADPRDVGVERNVTHPEREQERARRGLVPDPGEREQPRLGFGHRLGGEAVERDPPSGAIAVRMSRIRADLIIEMPPGRIASSTSATGASRTASQLGNRSRRRK
jgi:hypothetical protein